MFKFSAEKGILNCQETAFDNGEVKFVFSDFTVSSKEISWVHNKSYHIGKAFKMEFQISDGRALNISVQNTDKREHFLEDVIITFTPGVMSRDIYAENYYEYIHSFNFSENCGVKKVGLNNRWLEHNPESSMVYVISEIETAKSTMFSTWFPHQGDYVFFKALHEKLHLEGRFGLQIRSEQRRLLLPGKKVHLSKIQCKTGNNPLALLEDYGKNFGKTILEKKKLKGMKYGWNSWDYFAGTVESKDIFKNQKESSKKFPGKIEYFIIDEGWEPRWGDWFANWKFPEGLGGYCKKIKENGGRPGIWTAPLMVNQYTKIYREHPEWFGKNKSGDVVSGLYSYGPMAYLDPTHPEAAEYLHDVYSRLKRDGFEYFKVDFTQEVLKCDIFHDMTIGRGNVIRRLFTIIRNAIGKNSYLLACGAPFESVTGLVDSVRTSGDIHNFWSHIVKDAGGISSRWWMTRNLWNTDPDFLIVRNSETTSDNMLNRKFTSKPFDLSWLAGREMNNNETMVYCLMLYLSCGDIILSDDLTKLNKNGIEIIRKILNAPKLTKAAVPTDMFKTHATLPSIWVAMEKDFAVIGLLNWEEDTTEKTIDLNAMGFAEHSEIVSFWDNENLIPENGQFNIKLSPRSCKGMIVKP